jgi:hypothetical protein
MGKTLKIEGQKFNRLTAIKALAPHPKTRRIMWEFLCDCGGSIITSAVLVSRGETKSCGCLQKEKARAKALRENFRHGGYGTAEYAIWSGMKQRCFNPRSKHFKDWGARGITVCDRWLSFPNFLSDMGFKPSPHHSIHRIDNDGNYEPSNCKWATAKEQCTNRRPSEVCLARASSEVLQGHLHIS